MRNLSIAVGVLVAFVSGCATVASGDIPSSLADVPPEKTGIVFGSIGIGAKTLFTNQGLRYRQLGASENALIQFREGIIDTATDFTEGSVKGNLFLLRLPPGEYELFNARFVSPGPLNSMTTFTAKSDFSVPFVVTQGKATYLGEFITYSLTGKNFLGVTVPAGGYFVVSNKLDRDLVLLGKKGGTLPREQVIETVLNPRTIGSPVFQDKPLP